MTSTESKTEITLKGSVEIVSEFFFTAINSILYQRGTFSNMWWTPQLMHFLDIPSQMFDNIQVFTSLKRSNAKQSMVWQCSQAQTMVCSTTWIKSWNKWNHGCWMAMYSVWLWSFQVLTLEKHWNVGNSMWKWMKRRAPSREQLKLETKIKSKMLVPRRQRQSRRFTMKSKPLFDKLPQVYVSLYFSCEICYCTRTIVAHQTYSFQCRLRSCHFWANLARSTCSFTQIRLPRFQRSGKIPMLVTLSIARKSSFVALQRRWVWFLSLILAVCQSKLRCYSHVSLLVSHIVQIHKVDSMVTYKEADEWDL